MTARSRRLALGGGGVLALAVVLAAVAWLGRSVRDPAPGTGPSPPVPGGLRHLEATVKEIGPGRDRVALAHGLLGLDVTHVRVDRQTAITVGDKEGGIGDLRDGRRVRVTYQLGPQGAVARSIDVLLPESAGSPHARPGPPPLLPADPASGPREASGIAPPAAARSAAPPASELRGPGGAGPGDAPRSGDAATPSRP
ncbi:MAG TPA: hypothetical protein VNO23_05010, partial [Candidatus Binatia bacterium]|nr:hypothetical protein [Candidatus Binatia bacterium]